MRPGKVMTNLAALRTHTWTVRAQQPAGLRWQTILEELGLKTAVEPFTKHVDALIANKARELLEVVTNWVHNGKCMGRINIWRPECMYK